MSIDYIFKFSSQLATLIIDTGKNILFMGISTKPISGMRDFLPTQLLKRHYVIAQIKTIYQHYGFMPLETPSIEKLAILQGKYGDENDQLIFKILHRGEKLNKALAKDDISEADITELGLRFDLTVPLARVVAEYHSQLPKYFKRYQIQPVWRADRPAKGRFREFYQCDIDMIGTTSLVAEVELLSAVADVLDALGLTDCHISFNHRQLLRAIIAQVGIAAEQEQTALIALDKVDKIGEDGVHKELCERGINSAAADKLLSMTSSNQAFNHDADHLAYLAQALDATEGETAIAELQTMLELAKHSSAANKLSFAPRLARGLGYYTGPIFEITCDELSISLGGGGRYDQLVGMFGKAHPPAVGFSLGLERILTLMEDRQLFPEHITTHSQVLICPLYDKAMLQAVELAQVLRKNHVVTDIYPECHKLAKQLSYANDQSIPFAVLIGDNEIANNTYTVKDLNSGQQETVALDAVINKIKA